ncbi:hypothetical protein AB1J03_16065 [Vibrio diabolicus]|uniref:hypothetical protein n=1 Tax=Vibrio diabolicus TaxID=50719 RepID=UPI00211B5CE8|nr:hypothetical protein [Vibrio diabolicus]MCG6242430.1 hypothetical protein [Vibrio diabolicus]
MDASDFLPVSNYLKRLDQVAFDSTRLQPTQGDIQYDTWTTVLELTGPHIIDVLTVAGSNTMYESEHVQIKWFVDGVEMVPRATNTQILVPVIGTTGAVASTSVLPELLDASREYCKSSFVCQVYVPTVATYGVQVLARYSRVKKEKL